MTTLQVSKQNSRTVAGMAGGRTWFRSVLPVLLAFLLIVGGLAGRSGAERIHGSSVRHGNRSCQRCSSER